MNFKPILLLGFLLLLPIATATNVSVSVYSEEDINGYFGLNSGGDTNLWVDGVPYTSYVDYKVIEATKGGMSRTEVAKTLVRSWETFKGETNFPSNYDLTIASVYYRIIDHTLDYVYSNWIKPIQVRQNAIIETLDQEVYCKNLAKHYFKAYQENKFVCEHNNKTYYDDVDYAIQVKNNRVIK